MSIPVLSALKTGALIAAGFALCFAFDHAPWGIQTRYDRLAASDARCIVKRDAAISETWKWSAKYTALSGQRATEAQAAAKAIASATGQCITSSKSSFSAGVIAGRSLERKSHETPVAGNRPAVPDGMPVDFGALWRGDSQSAAPDH